MSDMIQTHDENGANAVPVGTTRTGNAPSIRPGENLQVLSKPGIDAAALRNLAQAEPERFAALLRDLQERRLLWVRGKGQIQDRDAEGFSFGRIRDLKGLRDALDLDITVKVPNDPSGRTVTTSAFPLATSSLMVVGVNEAYEAVPMIGQELVQEVDDNKKVSAYAGVLSLGKSDYRTEEAGEFPMLSASEESYFIDHLRKGAQIAITQEMFEENDLAGIEARLTNLGEIAAELIEEQTLQRVTDYYGSANTPTTPYVLKVNGSGTAFFQTNNTTLTRLHSSGNRVQNNALVDYTDLENARLRLAGQKNSRGKRIMVPNSELVLLIPDALWVTAWKILNSVMEPGVFNESNFYGPQGAIRPRILSSSKLDDDSTSAWYLGAPRRVFRRKWKIRPEIVTYGGRGTESYVRTRESVRVRVCWDMEVGAIDSGLWWIQCLTGTTPPNAT